MARTRPTPAALASLLRRAEAKARARRAAATRLADAVAEYNRTRQRAAFAIAQCLATFRREKLYRELGHATFADLAAALGMSRAQAFKLAAVGAGSSAAEVERLGVEASYRASVARAAPRPPEEPENTTPPAVTRARARASKKRGPAARARAKGA